jgi:uncharacterized delta-60 repeat protein
VSLDPDPTFGTDGVHRMAIPPGAVQSLQLDGSQIVGAGSFVGAANHDRVFVARFADDGSPDAGYGDAGVASAFAPGLRSSVTHEVLSDGSAATAYNRKSGIVVHKWTPDGVLDTSFSGDGVRLVEMSITRYSTAPKLAVDTQGRIVVAGMDEANDGYNVIVARLTSDGAYDQSFSSNGRVTVNRGEWDWSDALATDANDRILLGSDNWTLSGKRPDSGTVMRLRGNGSLDTNFSGNGVVKFRMLRGGANYPVEIAVAASGDVTVAAVNGGVSYGAVRLTSDGSFDTSYGHDGVLSMNCECWLYSASIDDGRVAFAGNKGYNPQLGELDWTAIVVRISASGVRVDRQHMDLVPDAKTDIVNSVLIDGSRTLIGGETRKNAFVARLG